MRVGFWASVFGCASSLAASATPKSMRAWHVECYPDAWQNVNYTTTYAVPSLQAGEVMVELRASSVNPNDYTILTPYYQQIMPLTFPHTLGGDGAGVVAALGPHTTGRFKVGDEVWWASSGGAYADYAAVSEAALDPKPESLSFEEAAALTTVGLTSMSALTKADHVVDLRGKTVLVIGGSGGTGHVAVQLAKHRHGAGRVMTTTSAQNDAWMRRLGADEVIDYHSKDWWNSSVVADASVDFIYDTVGQAETGPRATKKLAPGGLLLMISFAHGGLDDFPPPNVFQAFHTAGSARLSELRAVVDKGLVRPTLAGTYDLPDLIAAWNESAAGHVHGKLAISMARHVIV